MPSAETFNPEAYEVFLAERRAELLERVAAAAQRAGRNASDVLVEAVSKTVGTEQLYCAWNAGWRVFAENRPQELARKLAGVAEHPEMAGARFDMIGNLQKNKINQVLAAAPALIHSVSSVRLAEAISKRAEARDMRQPALLEVNVSGEASKSGMSTVDALTGFEAISELPGIEVRGLMTMAPAGNAGEARRTFSGLRELAERLRQQSGAELPVLSCGMSDDFEIAVEEGSTLVRLGRIVFSPEYTLG